MKCSSLFLVACATLNWQYVTGMWVSFPAWSSFSFWKPHAAFTPICVYLNLHSGKLTSNKSACIRLQLSSNAGFPGSKHSVHSGLLPFNVFNISMFCSLPLQQSVTLTFLMSNLTLAKRNLFDHFDCCPDISSFPKDHQSFCVLECFRGSLLKNVVRYFLLGNTLLVKMLIVKIGSLMKMKIISKFLIALYACFIVFKIILQTLSKTVFLRTDGS